MVSTKIKDLDYQHKADFIADISPQEMEKIQGGVTRGSWRRSGQNRTLNRQPATTGLPEIDARINSWEAELEKNYNQLGLNFDF
ncbi:hypothetical protein WJM97_16480 [Okeanomitos corallinicola TIOX110]|uniref:Uncharacterized protein n=1 Tax=Okeanomitos corallinicola TIOX110 TaxID=3133117 RepID=A0ABZ2UPS4_9CYAN